MKSIDWKIAKAMRRMERRREKSKAIQVMTRVVAVTLLTGAAVMFSGAYNQPTETVLDVYIVEEGDTLWNLTEKYRERDARDPYILEYMNEVKQLNPELKENHGRLHPGQALKFEYKERIQ